ncbi:hypothetical protein CPC08DRAFT_762730 [Agrocybe pediades]|nr:hypothetical protein CPC08DRAFT_762730 [Agrocybe pediades]
MTALAPVNTALQNLLHSWLPSALARVSNSQHARTVSVVGGILCCMAIVRVFRWKKFNSVHEGYKDRWVKVRDAKGRERWTIDITPEEAQGIMKASWGYDMPTLLNYAIAFALFKTYEIPSISKLLCPTKELKSEETIAKRYADTELLISTWIACPISGLRNQSFAKVNTPGPGQKPAEDPRAMIALARVNYLHSKYRISNDDFLYTLALFALEGNAWAKRYGWRELSPLERHAQYVFWAEIGRRMNIQDIPDSFESLQEWARDYERVHMVPAQSNHDLAEYTLDELLSATPNILGLRALGRRVAICLMDDIVPEAMMYPKQPWILHASLTAFLRSFHYFERWFLLPRRKPRIGINYDLPKPGEYDDCPMPRLYPKKWPSRPWYKPELTTFVGRWQNAFLVKIGYYKELPGPHLKSEGYRIEEMGPLKYEKEGHEEVVLQASKLLGCPVTGPWSLGGARSR